MILIVLDSAVETCVFKRWKASLLTFLLGAVLATLWENLAVLRGHWWFGYQYMLGIRIGLVPIEEVIVWADLIFIPILLWEYFK